MEKRIQWKKSIEGYVASRDGRFTICPVRKAFTETVEYFEVHAIFDGKRFDVAPGVLESPTTQRRAKALAERWLNKYRPVAVVESRERVQELHDLLAEQAISLTGDHAGLDATVDLVMACGKYLEATKIKAPGEIED